MNRQRTNDDDSSMDPSGGMLKRGESTNEYISLMSSVKDSQSESAGGNLWQSILNNVA